VRKALIVAILMLIPGCLDTTPEEISGVQIQLPIGSIIEGDTATLMASGQSRSEQNIFGTLEMVPEALGKMYNIFLLMRAGTP